LPSADNRVRSLFCCHCLPGSGDLDEISKSTISQTGDYPAVVKSDMEKYMAKNPSAKLTYMEGDPAEVEKLASSSEVKSRVVSTYDVDKDGIEKKGVLLSKCCSVCRSFKNG
jgi:hypothetical protein